MKVSVLKRFILSIVLLAMSVGISWSQQIDVNAGYGSYDRGHYTGYNGAAALGIFYSSAGKTSGVIPAYTAQLTITLAPQAPWTGEAFVMPDGWEMDPASTTTNLTFYNSLDWTTEDPYFEIPIKAIAPRSSTALSVGTQIFNIGGDWMDDGQFNNTISGITIADINLPVTLVSFTAVKEGSVALLNWATASEINSDRFEIEHSLTGKNWTKIGTVATNGESTVKRDYSFTDKSVVNGENLYRLKMVDKDATFAYSRIQSIKFDGLGSDLSIYPNPVADKMVIRDFAQVTNVVISDLNGRSLLQSGSTSTGEINVQSLTAGMYIVKISRNNGIVSSQKIVVSK